MQQALSDRSHVHSLPTIPGLYAFLKIESDRTEEFSDVACLTMRNAILVHAQIERADDAMDVCPEWRSDRSPLAVALQDR